MSRKPKDLLDQTRRRIALCIMLGSCIGCSRQAAELSEPGRDSEIAAPIVSSDGPRRMSPSGRLSPSVIGSTEVVTVEYFNPNTGTHSSYELEVDRGIDGRIDRINFPNEGWLEVGGQTVDNGDGTETFTSDNGAEYRIHSENNSPSVDDDPMEDESLEDGAGLSDGLYDED